MIVQTRRISFYTSTLSLQPTKEETETPPSNEMQLSGGLDSSGDRHQDSCDVDWSQVRIFNGSGTLALIWNAIFVAEHGWRGGKHRNGRKQLPAISLVVLGIWR